MHKRWKSKLILPQSGTIKDERVPAQALRSASSESKAGQAGLVFRRKSPEGAPAIPEKQGRNARCKQKAGKKAWAQAVCRKCPPRACKRSASPRGAFPAKPGSSRLPERQKGATCWRGKQAKLAAFVASSERRCAAPTRGVKRRGWAMHIDVRSERRRLMGSSIMAASLRASPRCGEQQKQFRRTVNARACEGAAEHAQR